MLISSEYDYVLQQFYNVLHFSDFDIQVQFNLNQCRAEEITMKEDFIIMHAFEDEGFGDTPFGASDEKELLRAGTALDDSSFIRSKDKSNLLLEESDVKDGSVISDKQKIGMCGGILNVCWNFFKSLEFHVKIH